MEKDLSSIVEREKKQFKFLISIFVAALIFMVGQPLSSFAIDSYVGERGTYDSIRLSGVEISQFILGKTIFTISVGLISGTLQMATVFTLLSQADNVVNQDVLEYIPLLNINRMVLKNAHGSASILPLLVSVILGSIIAAIVTQMSVLKLRNKEM